MRADGFGGHENEVVESAAKRAESESEMNDPINQEHEDVLNFAHSLPSGLTKEQIYVRIHERAAKEAAARVDAAIAAHNEAVSEQERIAAELSSCRAAAAAGLPADELREKVRDAVEQSMTSLYVCGRVWSAWQVGTMTQDDFTPAAEDDDVLDEITGAVLAALPADPVDESQPAAQWVSVKDRMPKEWELVLTHGSKRVGMAVMQYSEQDRWQIESANEWHAAYPPTHWMPLPAAPAMEAQSHE